MLSCWKLLSKQQPVFPRNPAHDQQEPTGTEMDPRRQKLSHRPPQLTEAWSRTKGTCAKHTGLVVQKQAGSPTCPQAHRTTVGLVWGVVVSRHGLSRQLSLATVSPAQAGLRQVGILLPQLPLAGIVGMGTAQCFHLCSLEGWGWGGVKG